MLSRHLDEKTTWPRLLRPETAGFTVLGVAGVSDELVAMGKRIRKLRKSHALNQAELAQKVGVDVAGVSAWETGKRPPGPKNLKGLTDFFGVSPQHILRGDTLDLSTAAEQLDRIEAKLDRLSQLLSPGLEAAEAAREIADHGDRADRLSRQDDGRSTQTPGRSKTRRAGSRHKSA